MSAMEITDKGKRYLKILGAVAMLVIVIIWAVNRPDQPPTPPEQIIETHVGPGFTGRLPYSTNTFSIDYLAEIDTYSVIIYEGPVEQRKTEALDYLRKSGANLEKSKVSYEFVEESPGWGE